MDKKISVDALPRLVRSFGRDFEFYGRDDAIHTLWNGDPGLLLNGVEGRFKYRYYGDKIHHPIPVLAGGPGTGKSRFLDEVERLLLRCANNSDSEEIRNAFINTLVINTTYGNGTAASDKDREIGSEASLGMRILFYYFQPQHLDSGNFVYPSFYDLCCKSNVSNLRLSTALQVVYSDVMQIKQPITPNPLLVLVLGIDEFNKLHDIDREASKKLIHAIGTMMCGSPRNIFFVPILAGTVEGPLENYITGSMHKPLRLPLPLLDDKDAIKISKAINLDKEYIRTNPYFRLCIGDIGGHVRALEHFYEFFGRRLKLKGNAYDVQVSEVISEVETKIKLDYNLEHYSDWLTEVLAKAILGLPVRKNDRININGQLPTYQELSSMGILNLVFDRKNDRYQIRIPYLWASILVHCSKHPEMSFWQEMLDYVEPMYWQDFEDFNSKFWALRLILFRLAGYSTINLKELVKGAILSRSFPDVEVTLPNTIQFCRLKHRYPEGRFINF